MLLIGVYLFSGWYWGSASRWDLNYSGKFPQNVLSKRCQEKGRGLITTRTNSDCSNFHSTQTSFITHSILLSPGRSMISSSKLNTQQQFSIGNNKQKL